MTKNRPVVREGNLLNARIALLCMIAFTLGVHFVVEQPCGSLFFNTPLMRAVAEHTCASRIHLWMRNFGHPTPKCTWLFGTPGWLPTLRAPVSGEARRQARRQITPSAKPKRAVQLAIRGVNKHGRATYTGALGALKQSQVYPAKFALAVVRAHFPQRFSGG